MSQWTHVSGCIRIDGFVGFNPVMDRRAMEQVRDVLGTPSTDLARELGGTYEPGKNMPSGSEGTMQYAIAVAGTGMVWLTVAVWGDLRDFGADDAKEIDDWFARVVRALPIIRAASLLVEIEYGARYLLVADDDKEVRRVILHPMESVAPETTSQETP